MRKILAAYVIAVFLLFSLHTNTAYKFFDNLNITYMEKIHD